MPSSNSFCEQPSQDHRIGDVGDVEFVEAQKPGLVEDRRGGERDHIAVGDLAARDILAIAVDPLMHLGHEFVEVRAALVHDRAVLEEQIHQHGLAAADFAVNVEAARRRLVLVGEQPAEQALLAQRLVARKPLLEVGECLGGLLLRGVGLDRAGGHEGSDNGRGTRRTGEQHGPLTASTRRKIASAMNWCRGYALAFPSVRRSGGDGAGTLAIHALSA